MSPTARPVPAAQQSRHRQKLILVSSLVAALAVLVFAGEVGLRSASADPESLFPLQNSMEPGDNVTLVARFSLDDGGGDESILVSVSPGSGAASLTVLRCFLGGADGAIQTSATATTPAGDDEACAGPTTDSNGLANELTFTDTIVNGLDGDALPADEEILLILRFRAPSCTNQTYTFESAQPSNGTPIAGAEAVVCAVVTNTPEPTATALPPRDTCFVAGAALEAPACAVVITADPNLVACGGRSVITATVRDRDGHVVLGYGFHFATDNGLLSVGPPNNAGVESATALLQLFPPGSSNPTGSNTATVIVSVGTSLGTIEGTVTVQQYCPTSSTTAGNINITASAPLVPCNGRVFLAGSLKDVNGNPVPDGTEVTFLASAGSVSTSAVAAGGGATPTAGSGNSPSVTVTTRGGTANLIYTGDGGASGTVLISAASGASFGSLNLTVCTQTGGVTPPRTGTGFNITPPNTGDAGLAAD